jgi:YD repeat-containing protein
MDARGIATWRPGGPYKLRPLCAANSHTTIVSDSRGADTIYQMDADNAVVCVTGALGAVTRYEFDDSGHRAAGADPIDRATRRVFDGRDNCSKIVHSDGAEVNPGF